MNRVPGEGFVANPSGLFLPSLTTDMSLGKEPQISGLVVPAKPSNTFIIPEKNDIPDGIEKVEMRADREPYYLWLGEHAPATFNRLIAELGLKQLKETFGDLNKYKDTAGNSSAEKSLLNIMIRNESAGENPQLSDIHYPAESYNGLVDKLVLGQPKNTFGDQKKYKNKKNGAQMVLSLLNGDVTAGEYPLLVNEYYELIAAVNVRAPDISLKERGLWDIMSLMADHIMIQSNMDDLPMTDGLLDFSMRALEVGEMPEQMLDFLSHFDIPKELAGKILDRIDEHPNHPLYWWVATRSPEHPEVLRQKNAVAAIKGKNIVSGDLDIHTMMPLGLLVNNPEQQFPRTGIELETNLPVERVLVPEGTILGTDSAENNEEESALIPELRLADQQNQGVLDYGPSWLRRYFEIWRWERVSRGLSSSVHLHSEGNNYAKFVAACKLFGTDYDDCRENELGTIEVRTALSAYIDENSDGHGFPCLPHPSLIELLHTCDDRTSLYDLSLARVRATIYRARLADHGNYDTCPKEDSSGHKLYPILTQLGILKPDLQKTTVTKILSEGSISFRRALISLIKQYIGQDLQAIIADAVLERGTIYDLGILVGCASSLEPNKQKQIVEHVLDKWATNIYMLTKLLNIGLAPDLQQPVCNAILSIDYQDLDRVVSNLSKLIPELDKLIPDLQIRAVDAVLKTNDTNLLAKLTQKLHALTDEVKNSVIDAVLKSEDVFCLNDLACYSRELEPNIKQQLKAALDRLDPNSNIWRCNMGRI